MNTPIPYNGQILPNQNHMKLDSRQKHDRIKQFINQLKDNKHIQPFLNTDEITKYGIFDFYYINSHPPTLQSIEKKLKEQKYESVTQVFEELTLIFTSVSDYAFTDDPIQSDCQQFICQIQKFRNAFLEEFSTVANVTRSKHKITCSRKDRLCKQQLGSRQYLEATSQSSHRTSNMEDKLSMVLWLKTNQNNEAFLHMIADQYQIGAEDDNYFYINIDNKNSKWLQFIDTNNF